MLVRLKTQHVLKLRFQSFWISRNRRTNILSLYQLTNRAKYTPLLGPVGHGKKTALIMIHYLD